jgi:uncharacterized protein YcbK (DUF882 family)
VGSNPIPSAIFVDKMHSKRIAMTSTIIIPRRNFIQTAGVTLLGSCFLPNIVWGAASKVEERLKLYHMHTGETFNEVFWAQGKFIPEAVKSLNKFMRDWRTDEVKDMCPSLFVLLNNVYRKIGAGKPIHVISAYRCEKTNAELRKKSKRVAKESRHKTGQAIDFSIPGVNLKTLRNAAASFKAGGVGYYPASGFIHADIREKPVLW